MKCAKDYQAVISADGRLAFVIPAGKDEPHSPKLIYNGGESALLYRSAADILVLDKLHEEAQKALCRKRSVVIMKPTMPAAKPYTTTKLRFAAHKDGFSVFFAQKLSRRQRP